MKSRGGRIGLRIKRARMGLGSLGLLFIVATVGLRCAPGDLGSRTFTTVIDSPIADQSLSVSPGRPAARAVLTTLADALPLADATQLSLALDAADVDVILGDLAPAPGARTLTIQFSLATADGDDPCAATDLVGEFTVAVDGAGAVLSVEPAALQFGADAVASIAVGAVTLCTRIEADFAAEVSLAEATVAVVVGSGASTNDNGGTSGNDNASNGNANSSPLDNSNDNGSDDSNDDDANGNASDDDSADDNGSDDDSDDDNANDNSADDGNDNAEDDSGNENDNGDDSVSNDNSSDDNADDDDDSSGNDNGSDDGGNDNDDDSSGNDNSSDDDDGGSGNANDNRDDDGDDDSNGGGDDD